jgi:hypothetical protein
VRKFSLVCASYLFSIALACTPSHCNAFDFGVSGLPITLGQTRDYDSIFSDLLSAGITVFFPTSQYQEQPTSLALGTESDFLAPCSPQDKAFEALRRHEMQLVLTAELLYPRGQPFPSIADDPISKIIECAGRNQIYGVLSYDEPTLTGADPDAVAQVYERVKEIDATLPVLMVHAAIALDRAELATDADRAAYLAGIREVSAFSDIVGFDVYPVIPLVSQVSSPYSNELLEPKIAVADHLRWLVENLPEHRHLMVLQGFSYDDLYAADYLPEVASADLLSALRAPDHRETFQMAESSVNGGADLVMWWGLSFQPDATSSIWIDVKDTARLLVKSAAD